MEKNIIKIQRYFRIHKLSNLFDNFEKYLIDKQYDFNFENYTKKLRKKELILLVKKIFDDLNKLCNLNYKICPRTILSGFLVKNFTEDIIGQIKDRHPIDIYLIDWSKKLVEVFKKENELYKYKLLLNYANNYMTVFNDWKNIDRNRTSQNIIISYSNRMNHLNIVKNEDMNEISKLEIVNTLNKECNNLLDTLVRVDPGFNTSYLKENHNEIVVNIRENMMKVYNEISSNFKDAYLDIVIEEYKNDNNQVILNLFNETNDRILKLTPKEYHDSIKSKLNSNNNINLLLNDSYDEIIEYLLFLVDTVIVYSSKDDDEENISWKQNVIERLNCDTGVDFKEFIPCLLIEINNKIDNIINKINNLI